MKMKGKSMINSKDYWEQRFESQDWDEKGGMEQTDFFNEIAIKLIPQWIVDEIQTNNLSIIDVGCAKGEGTFILKQKFGTSNVIGLDFSESAIESASAKYPSCKFIQGDMSNIKESYDVVFTSNVLEHFVDPFDKIEKLIKNSKKYLIMMIPFQENKLHEEHFFKFDYASFPIEINDYYQCFYKVINTENMVNTMWPGKQIFLVYVNKNHISPSEIKLSRTHNYDFEEKEEIFRTNENLKNDLKYWVDKNAENELELDNLNFKINNFMEEKKNYAMGFLREMNPYYRTGHVFLCRRNQYCISFRKKGSSGGTQYGQYYFRSV